MQRMASEVGLESGVEVWVTCREQVWRPGVVFGVGDGFVDVEVINEKGKPEHLQVVLSAATAGGLRSPPMSPPAEPKAPRSEPELPETPEMPETPESEGGGGGGWFFPRSPLNPRPAAAKGTSFRRPAVVQPNSQVGGRAPQVFQLHKRNEALQTREGAMAAQDLSKLPLLHEPAILHALQVRFEEDIIYTQTGPMLLAVNPFKPLPDLYSVKQMRQFVNMSDEEPPNPHVFRVARAAYKGIWDFTGKKGMHQTVLVSGESGAGKTETTKFVMRFLALAGAGCTESSMSAVERQVLDSIPLMEALGNAKTLRNDNSSRFGKYIELQFRREVQQNGRGNMPRLVGAYTHTYLLEKVRVTTQQEGERSFHIFYQLLAAAAQQPQDDTPGRPILASAKHFKATDFDYIKQSATVKISELDEAKCFDTTLAALTTFGVSEEEAIGVVDSLMAVLHIGNIAFATPARNSEGSEPVETDRAGVSFLEACKILGVQPDELGRAWCWKTRTAPGGQVISSPVPCTKAREGRDALARHLYAAIFSFVLERVNSKVSVSSDDGQNPFIGLLDIFGFEFFPTNSLEQLMINFTNELLQKHFNEVIFEHEAELYKDEGIHWDPLEFPDNSIIVNLIGQVPGGLLPLLEEECQQIGGTSERWCSKMAKDHASNRNFRVVLHRQECFVVEHFAGPVEYTSSNFFEKNLDTLGADLVACLHGSNKPFIQQRFQEHDRIFGSQDAADVKSGSRKKAKAYSVSYEFRLQLKDLMDRVKMTHPHFVRCIKPNPGSKPGVFNRRSVVEQLQYQGVLQAIEVSRAGFPLRLPHERSIVDFLCLAPPAAREAMEAHMAQKEYADAARILFTALGEHLALAKGTWEIGNNLVFFKRVAVEALNKELFGRRAKNSVRIQNWWRMLQARFIFRATVAAVVNMQALGRGHMARRLAQCIRVHNAAVKLQCLWRTHKAHLKCKTRRKGLTTVQNFFMATLARKAFLRKRGSSIKVQGWWRKELRKHAHHRSRSATMLQSLWRGCRARKRAAMLAEERNAAATTEELAALDTLLGSDASSDELLAATAKLQESNRERARSRSSAAQPFQDPKYTAALVARLQEEMMKLQEEAAMRSAEKRQWEEERRAMEAELAALRGSAGSEDRDLDIEGNELQLRETPLLAGVLRRSITRLFGSCGGQEELVGDTFPDPRPEDSGSPGSSESAFKGA